MRIPALLLKSFILNLFLISISFAQDGSYGFRLESGSVVVTPARCMEGECTSTEAKLTGSLSATIAGGSVTFTDIAVRTSPEVGFTLPEEPSLDSGGTNREVRFEFDGSTLSVTGVVDSRAFDGPLYEYSFTATAQNSSAAFDPKGYYTVRPDLRRCAAPACGGYFVAEVNKKLTRCADGRAQQECYVASIDWRELGFDALNSPVEDISLAYPRSGILLQGRMEKPYRVMEPSYAVFKAKGAYRAATANPAEGTFVGLENKGIMCITSPCFSIEAYVLNSSRARTISDFDLNPVGATNEQVAEAYTIFGNGDALIAAGEARKVELLHGTGITFYANQFYLPIKKPDLQPQPQNID